jgi:hypothetical protein
MNARRFLTAAALAGLALAAIATPSATASAEPPPVSSDDFPCGDQFPIPGKPFEVGGSGIHQLVRNCPDWSPSGSIPVFSTTTGDFTVGEIDPAGDDWYACQARGVPHVLNGLENDWWAATRADNGQPGYVPETYFRGGGPFEKDRTLELC